MFQDIPTRLKNFLNRNVQWSFYLWMSTIGIFLIVIEVGFKIGWVWEAIFHYFYLAVLLTACLSIISRFLNHWTNYIFNILVFDILSFLIYLLLILIHMNWIQLPDSLSFFDHPVWLYLTVFFYFIREFSANRIFFNTSFLNPAQLFLTSFALIILLGSLLLMLPNATYSDIKYIDALFTSTSAVCVTGLSVLDTGTQFTRFGQTIILGLIQIGGIGIMTFASYFSFFFKGGSSYENQLMVKDLTNSEKISEVFDVLKKIIYLTFIIEILGAFLLFISIEHNFKGGFRDQVFFSVFHSVSSFCNAGISTISTGLYHEDFRFNYVFLTIVALLFIMGSSGFPIIFNLYKYLKFYFYKKVPFLNTKKDNIHLLWVVNLNSRIVVYTTIVLLIFGTFAIFIFEFNNGLQGHHLPGKVVISFFSSAARTSGFHTMDTTSLYSSTYLILMFLMWIGASPGSTGGGIKTSTFAIAAMNIYSFMRGRERIEVFGREIADNTVKRSYAVIVLSIIAIGISTFLLVITEPEMELMSILFESVSAYSTTGYSTGITPFLSPMGKLILIVTMFVGRITLLTVLIAFFRKMYFANYRYPTEDIMIN